jgi:RNA 2',3'-cyclic 3'-phosphodiesterase
VGTRTFIAIEFASPLIQALTRRIRYLHNLSPSVRWVDPASLHLTLTFLGDLDDVQLASATEAALTAATGSRPFRLVLGNLGYFGPPTRPTVVWAGVTGDLSRLHQLQADLTHEQSMRHLPDQDHHAFSPHLTLARLGRSPDDPDEVARLLAALAKSDAPSTPPEMLVDQISVMKSQLARPHAIYTRLAACPLLGGAGSGPTGPSHLGRNTAAYE